MKAVDLIRKKRDGGTLTQSEIEELVNRYASGDIPDYQMSAFLMAGFLQGINHEEASHITNAMLHSGTVIDLSSFPGKKVDKHSTGGVGDKLSLILAPIVASCGVGVPMISGRGLGHTGGTLDKLQSIPGFNVNLSLDEYKRIFEKAGLVMAGQSKEVAPADRKMYALRDVTATVESIPLIAGSIMSKKLAEGIDALVLDVKVGSGAFMKEMDDALSLGRTLVEIGEHFGKRTIAYVTDMEQPLGNAVGNWLEVCESIDCLKGKGPEDVMEITHLLAATMIMLGDKADSVEEGLRMSREAVSSGKAMEKFMEMVEVQGGDPESVKGDPDPFRASCQLDFKAPQSGYIHKLDAVGLGELSRDLGAGRHKMEDEIDANAGLWIYKKRGDYVEKDETLLRLCTKNEDAARQALDTLQSSSRIISIEPHKLEPTPLIYYKIDADGVHEYGSN